MFGIELSPMLKNKSPRQSPFSGFRPCFRSVRITLSSDELFVTGWFNGSAELGVAVYELCTNPTFSFHSGSF